MHTPQHRRRRSCVDTMIATTTSEHYSEHHRKFLETMSNNNAATATPKRRGKRRVSMAKAPPHILAQKHNDRGVHFVESGQYEEAISYFIKAFKFSQLDTAPVCECAHCTLLSTVLHSTGSSSGSTAKSSSLQSRSDDEEGDDSEEEFLYSEGIRIPLESQGHSMGRTFQIVLAFNLALANHLSWATRKDMQDFKKLNRILQLYKLSYHLQQQEQELSNANDTINLRFTLIILNNLSQIHLALNEEERYHSVLENLLSHLMLVGVVEQRIASLSNNSTLSQHGQPTAMDLNGFFKNVSPLLLKRPCAGVA